MVSSSFRGSSGTSEDDMLNVSQNLYSDVKHGYDTLTCGRKDQYFEDKSDLRWYEPRRTWVVDAGM